MTDQDWKEVEKRWGYYGDIHLKVDGYKITLQLQQSKMKLVMFVYVNGSFKRIDVSPANGKMIGTEEPEWTEIAIRFYRTHKKRMYSAQKIKEMEKAVGKRYLKKRGYYDTYMFAKYPWWTSFQAFKCHLIKYNKNIELLEANS